MPRTKLLVSTIALALAGMGSAQAQEFSSVISFGDSLSDAGQYTVLISPAAGSFTTNPDDVWTQVLANAFGLSQTASAAGGTDYAYGGAPTSFSVPTVPFPLSCVPASLPCRSVQQQIGQYLTTAAGHADPNALYTYWAGANDIFNYLGAVQLGFITPTQAQSFTGASALTAIGEISALQAAGASHIVVLNLPDIGVTPAFRTSPSSSSISGLVFVYNSTLNTGLASLQDGIIPINAYQLIGEVMADPALYGFSNVTGTACNIAVLPNNSSLFCSPATYVAPGADQTYLFADGVHPSGAAHAMLARVVLATIQAPGQVSMAGELPLQVYDNHANVINGNIFTSNAMERAKGDSSVFGQIQYGRRDFDATPNTGAFDSNVATATLGADVRASEHFTVGAAASFGGTRGDGQGSSIDAKEVLFSGYGVANWGMGYIDLIATGGSSSLDIDRSIDFTASTRVEHGNTTAQHWAVELGGGLSFGNDDFHHGPFVSYTDETVRVKHYAEDSLDSTSMWFSAFTRHAQIGRIGYQASGQMGSIRPFGRVAYATDSQNHGVDVQAGSNTMNGHFTFPGYFGADHWIEAELGLGWAINDHTEINASYRGRFNEDVARYDALTLGFRMDFGAAAPAPAEAPEAAPEPAQTCADIDDDSDGVNNCDDKCPGSPAGEAVGADGCPVPAPEPEMAPKPFRG